MVGSMNGTIYMPVGEACSSISDTYREKKNMVTLINTSDVLEGRVLNHERVPNSNLKGQFKKTFQRDDILYSEIRPQNRRFAYVDFSPIDYIASTKLMVIRAKKDVVSPKYLIFHNPNAMICYLLHSEFFKKSNLYFHQFFAYSQLLLIHIANSKPWERFIFLSVTNEKIVPYQLIFTENEIELWT